MDLNHRNPFFDPGDRVEPAPAASIESRVTDVRVYDDDLLVKGDFCLPPQCVKTNAFVADHPVTERLGTFLEHAFIVGLLIRAWRAVFPSFRAPDIHVTYYLSRAYRKRRRLHAAIAWGVFLLLLPASCAGVPLNVVELTCLGGMVWFAAICFICLRPRPLWIVEYKNGEYRVAGCGKAFLTSIAGGYRFPQTPAEIEAAKPSIEVRGASLVITNNMVLPKWCVKTNSTDNLVEVTVRQEWVSDSAAIASMLSHVGHIAMHFTTKPVVNFTYYINADYLRRRRWLTRWWGFLFIGGVVACFIAAYFKWQILGLSIFPVWILGCVLFFATLKPIGVSDFKDGRLWIKGCGREFLDRLSKNAKRP